MKTMKYFSAKWCGPCRAFRPIIEEITGEESIIVEFIDVDQEQNKAEQYRVTAVPTIVVEENGIVIDRIIGALTKQQILERLM